MLPHITWSRARIRRDRICLDYLKMAWARQDAAREATKLLAAGRLSDAVEQLLRGMDVGRACLEHLERYRNERVFLTGRADEPKEKVGYFYTRSYHEKQLARLEATLARCRKALKQAESQRNLALPKKGTAQSTPKATDNSVNEKYYAHLCRLANNLPDKRVGGDFPASK